MEEEGQPTVSRDQVLAVLQNDDGTTCCLPFCKQTNKVNPTKIQHKDSEFFTFQSNRKIRIINKAPRLGTSSAGQGSCRDQCSETRTLEETLSDEEDDEEEDYWFENAAPNRLPVVQPPPPVHMNRIINKFEPRQEYRFYPIIDSSHI